MSNKKRSKKHIPVNNIFARCITTLSVLSSNANNNFDPYEAIDGLVLQVCKEYDPEDKECNLDEIISRLSMNMVYKWTDEIPF